MRLIDNIWKMYFLKAIMWFMVAMPIIVIFFQNHGLSLTEVMILQSVYSFTVALFEIPSGYIADLFGRKNTIIFSTFFCFIGYLIFSNYSDFYIFCLAEVFVGIGGSLMSGSDSALLYDTLLESDSKDEYTKIEGRNYAIGNFSEASAAILGGILATYSILLPVYVQTSILFFGIPIAFTLKETTGFKKNPIKRSSDGMLNIVQYVFNDGILKWLIVFSSIMGMATLSIAWLAQPIFNLLEIPIVYFGIIWAILNVSAGFTSFNSHIIEKKINNKYKLLITLSILIVISFLSIALLDNVIILFFVLLIYLIRGIITPIMKTYINNYVPSNKRATILSIRSFIIRIMFAITAPLLGLLTDTYSLNYSFYFLAIILAICIVIPLYNLKSFNINNS